MNLREQVRVSLNLLKILFRSDKNLKMNIQVFDINGRLVSDRSAYPFKTISDIAWNISENNPGGFIVNILIDEYVVKCSKSKTYK